MKKFFKVLFASLGIIIGIILLIFLIGVLWISASRNKSTKINMALAGPEVKTLTFEGGTFRDLNKNGSLDIYEDSRRSYDERDDSALVINQVYFLILAPV